MNHTVRALLVTSLVSLASLVPASSWAADACGGVKLEGGQVHLGKPLSDEFARTADGKACLAELAKAIERNRLVRAVTVAALVSDADRASGKGLASAKAIAAALVDAGLPKNRVFALAPAPQRTDTLGLSVRYVERAPEDVVARIASAGGASFLGADEPSLKPAEPGMPVLVNELVKTGPSARATVQFRDGSGVEVKPESLVKMEVLQIPPSGGERQVKILVLSGSIQADAKKATQNSRFEASSRVAVASVRGTQFRFGVDEAGGSKMETLEGVVSVAPTSDPAAAVDVPAGKGVAVSADGRLSPIASLPGTPRLKAPLKGALGADARFDWEPVADAASYRLELARDADFLVEARSASATTATLSWPEPLPKGKWFWRVSALDANGFEGPASKVYAFTVGK